MHGPLPHPLVRAATVSRRETRLVAALLLCLAVAARWQTFDNPILGYDEQFYLLVGDRMLHGALPYVDIFDRKPIGLFLIYAFARLLGGDGFLAYKLLALGFLALTALGVFHLARRFAGPFGAAMASAVFIVWHSFMGGEGGQSPVFYDLFMVAAAMLIVHAVDRPERLARAGAAAMLSVGLAMQVKYCALFEGVFFGCVLLWLAGRQGMTIGGRARCAAFWITAALAPTALAFGFYVALGHGEAFVFANFRSAFAQGRNPLGVQLRDLAEIVAILSPLWLLLLLGRRRHPFFDLDVTVRIARGWLLVSLAAVLLYFRFNSPHYALPLLLPLCLLLAPLFNAPGRRGLSLAFLVLALVAAQFVLFDQQRLRGGAREAALLAAAAHSAQGCIYVYAGFPALYQLTGSCLPSRWAFPCGLNSADEGSLAAQGIDPAAEVRRILATRPPVIVDEAPDSRFANRATRALVDRALARDYVLTARIASERGRAHFVYRLREAGRPSS